jgi:hypothetical protein
MYVIPLRDGRTLLHSPTWMGDDTFERIDALGRPGVLFAPNHFHHLGLSRFRARYPDALVVAGEGALPRLKAKGHGGLRELTAAEPLLPEGARLLRCAGLRTGEAWFSFIDDGKRTLLTSDAFFNVAAPVTGIAGFMLRRMQAAPGLQLGATFIWLGVRDRAAYRAWVRETLAREAPARILFSHGEPLEAADVSERLTDLIERRLR